MIPQTRRTFLQLAGAGLACSALRLAAEPPATPEPKDWTVIFGGKSLDHWKITEFAGHADVKVENGQIDLAAGNDLTGVNYTGDIPKTGYEISLEAMRIEGGDFFCGLTFPVGNARVTYVVGGWGGSVVGISSINGDDASQNETTKFFRLESKKWYRIRVRITDKKLEAWLNDDQTANVDLEGKKLAMRAGEIELSEPFGIATFRTHGALRDIKIRKL